VTGLLFNKLRQARACFVRFADPESYLLFIGVALLGLFGGAHLHSFLFSQIALWRSNIAAVSVASNGAEDANNEKVDISLWGKARIKAYHASLALKLEPATAVLSIRRLHLTVPVFEGTDAIILNRGAGRIVGTGALGGDGNVAIAGHRDGFFRALKDVQVGDFVEVETPTEKDTYIVEATKIVDPKDVSVLEPSRFASVTLVTCYPFYFIGDAPERFVVRGSLTHREFLQQARVVRQGQK
jgi:sortase A